LSFLLHTSEHDFRSGYDFPSIGVQGDYTAIS
jgi:hypothetical protein